MTKRRPPVSLQRAVTTIADRIGWPVAARLVRRTERSVRNWSDPDLASALTFDAALRLDAAWARAGGDGLPIADTYAALAEDLRREPEACPAALVGAIAGAVREHGEAVAAAALVVLPSSTTADAWRAVEEAEQAIARDVHLFHKLRRFARLGRHPGAAA